MALREDLLRGGQAALPQQLLTEEMGRRLQQQAIQTSEGFLSGQGRVPLPVDQFEGIESARMRAITDARSGQLGGDLRLRELLANQQAASSRAGATRDATDRAFQLATTGAAGVPQPAFEAGVAESLSTQRAQEAFALAKAQAKAAKERQELELMVKAITSIGEFLGGLF